MDCEFDVDTLPQMSPVSARELPRVVYTPAFGLITGKLRFNLRCFRFFVFAMDCLPNRFGNEPGVRKIEIYQAGSSQHKPPLFLTNVMVHGPGVKLLDGFAEARH